jgi:hypothetical protein
MILERNMKGYVENVWFGAAVHELNYICIRLCIITLSESHCKDLNLHGLLEMVL